MRLRLTAVYRGVPYQVGLGPDGTQATLLSAGPPPAGLGFTAAAGHWRKQVALADLDTMCLSRPVGEYRGEPCLVLDDLGDRLHIAYLGRDSVRAAQLGYWEIDREVFEVVVARHDVTRLTEERVEFPVTAAMFGTPGPGPAASDAPEEGRGAAPEVPAAAEEPAGNGREYGPNGTDHGPNGAGHGPRKPDRMTAWHGSPEPWDGPVAQPDQEPTPDQELELGGGPELGRAAGRRNGRGRVSPESYFAELLSLAAIPHSAYSVGREVPGAMCLVEANGGFEVFSRTDDARFEVHFFADEEAAYFYLFGVLAAEAVRSGRLTSPGRPESTASRTGQRRELFRSTYGAEKDPLPDVVPLGFV